MVAASVGEPVECLSFPTKPNLIPDSGMYLPWELG
jgi:hypothetical protein